MKISKQITKFAMTFFAFLVLTTFVFSIPPTGNGCKEGCTPGYWKNHTGMWPDGYTTDTLIFDVFAMPYEEYDEFGNPIGDMLFPELVNDTLLDALKYKGGRGMIGAVKIFLRHAVAALLNASHYGINYTLGLNYFITNTNEFLHLNRDELLIKTGKLEAWNEAYCPLNNGKVK